MVTNDIYKSWEIASGSSEDLSYMINGSLELIMKVSSSSDQKIELSLQCYKNQNQINLTESKECYKSFDLSKCSCTMSLTNEWQVIDDASCAALIVDRF